MTTDDTHSEPIAVIGMACRYPGAGDYDTFWRNLAEGKPLIREVPADRFDWRDYWGDPVEEANKTNSKWGAFVERIDTFDAEFFGISPREAQWMDPQQRFMLELTWGCIEDAGYCPSLLSGSQTGVFLGVCNFDYKELQDDRTLPVTGHGQTGTWVTLIPNRISYWFNFHGPSIPIDTACSSSLVAIHDAVHSLRRRECGMALAGGVSLICSPNRFIGFGQLGMLSPEGSCKTFDASADGYVRGEGAGLLLLKPLAQAIEDDDHIHGIIRGSAVNHDGRALTLTWPNQKAQAQLLVDAYTGAKISPNSITFIETHGTGTSLGDPIEIEGLKMAYARLQPHFQVTEERTNYCGLGAVKTHIGHLEAAAGIAGVMSALSAIRHRELPGIQNFSSINPRIELDGSPFYLVIQSKPWTFPEGSHQSVSPLRAGVNSFGAGGTNAHLILEEPPPRSSVASVSEKPRCQLVSLSSRQEPLLRELAGRYAVFLQDHPEVQIADISFTTHMGRAHFDHRLAIACESTEQLVERLNAYSTGRTAAKTVSGQAQKSRHVKTAFLFTGQGSQYVGMGRQLYQMQPTFRRALDRCDEILSPYLNRKLLEIIHPGSAAAPCREIESAGELDETWLTQPALFALEYALAELWKSWGVKPSVVMGHSVGEYVAACVAGVFSLEDGLKLIAERARLMQALPRTGQMAAVFANEAQVDKSLQPFRGKVSIAAVNGPNQVVISGLREAVQALCDAFETAGVTVKPLPVSHAFHSPLMKPMLKEFKKVASEIQYDIPQLTFISNLTGQIESDQVATAEYWCNHVLQPVRFFDSLKSLGQAKHSVFLEIGPKPTLTHIGRKCLPTESALWVTSLRKEGTDLQQVMETLGALYVRGVNVDWSAVHEGAQGRKIALPTYAFEQRRHWLDSSHDEKRTTSLPSPGARTTPVHPLLGHRRFSATDPGHTLFEIAHSRTHSPAFLADHVVFESPVFPMAAFLEMMLASRGSAAIEDVEIRQALLLDDEDCCVQCVATPAPNGLADIEIFSAPAPKQGKEVAPDWTLHATGRGVGVPEHGRPAPIDRDALLAGTEAMAVEEHYRRCRNRGLSYGPLFQTVTRLWKGLGFAVGAVVLPESLVNEADEYLFHPALLDGCFQVLLAAMPDDATPYLPVRIERMHVRTSQHQALWSHAEIRSAEEHTGPEELVADIRLFDEQGAIVAEVDGLAIRLTAAMT